MASFNPHNLNPTWSVEEASRVFGPETPGYIVMHRETGLWVYSGVGLTIPECMARIVNHIHLQGEASYKQIYNQEHLQGKPL